MAFDAEPAAIIIGGGITGLVCTFQLRQAGIDALCLESSWRPGGVISTRRVDGYLLEAGPNTVQETMELSDLVREAGLGAEVLRTLPPISRASSTGAAPCIRCRRVWLPRSPRRSFPVARNGLFSASSPYLGAPSVDDESVEAFVRRRFGAEIVDALVVPFVSGTFAGDPAKLSARAVLPALVAMEERHGECLARNGVERAS